MSVCLRTLQALNFVCLYVNLLFSSSFQVYFEDKLRKTFVHLNPCVTLRKVLSDSR